jgi:hypothetical protein
MVVSESLYYLYTIPDHHSSCLSLFCHRVGNAFPRSSLNVVAVSLSLPMSFILLLDSLTSMRQSSHVKGRPSEIKVTFENTEPQARSGNTSLAAYFRQTVIGEVL